MAGLATRQWVVIPVCIDPDALGTITQGFICAVSAATADARQLCSQYLQTYAIIQ